MRVCSKVESLSLTQSFIRKQHNIHNPTYGYYARRVSQNRNELRRAEGIVFAHASYVIHSSTRMYTRITTTFVSVGISEIEEGQGKQSQSSSSEKVVGAASRSSSSRHVLACLM